MTNRKDMIDDAVLRPGRLELHMEISLPDERGREQIFEIHTRKMRKNGLIDASVDTAQLAAMTKNFTGAEIESVCKNAISIALYKGVDISAIGKEVEETKKSRAPQTKQNNGKFEFKRVTMEDFFQALTEIKPAFGIDENEIDTWIRGGIIPYGQNFSNLQAKCRDFMSEIKGSKKTSLLSILLEGPRGSGKTAFAA